MAGSLSNNKYYISVKIALIYILISSLYIIFSDKLILQIFGNTLSVELFSRIETYKGLIFVAITSVGLLVVVQREINAKRRSLKELEKQKQDLLNITVENEKVKKRLQERNIYIETILRYLPIGMAVNKIDDRETIFLNEKFAEIYGWPENELGNLDNFFNNVYPDEAYRKVIKERVLADIASGDPNRMRWEGIEITTGTGGKKIINAQNIPVYEQNLMISTVQDITAMKQAEEKLRNNEKRFRELVNSMNSGIVVHAPDTSILYNNPKAIELLGLDNDHWKGKPAYEYDWNFIHEDHQPYTIDEFPVNQIINRKTAVKDITLGVIHPLTKDVT